jgi:hypothetical protein
MPENMAGHESRGAAREPLDDILPDLYVPRLSYIEEFRAPVPDR